MAANLHRVIDPFHEFFVSAVTYSEADVTQQSSMHEQDLVARWFRIKFQDSVRDQPRLQVYDRFRQLCNPGFSGNKWTSSQYPSFVSFIGNTCVGKSTLLRAMLLMGRVGPVDPRRRTTGLEELTIPRLPRLQELLSSGIPGPVTRTASRAYMTDPTSLGVHLYEDAAIPDHFETGASYPILFADCEGFRGGFATTNSERIINDSLRRDSSRSPQSSYSASSCGHDRQSTESNLIIDSLITADCYTCSGKEGAELFYARFLYAISDVVVFVTKEDTSLQVELQRLLEWAASAVYTSVNRVPLKTLIIVRNMPLAHDTFLYNCDQLRETLFDNLQPLWKGSTFLTDFVNDHNNKRMRRDQRIVDNEDLFRVFFQKISACYIPDKARAPANEIYRQYWELRRQIDSASRDGQVAREKSWMQYNVPALSHILNRAFEHFRTSDKPFDFYEAARKNNPNPVSMADHVANFLRHAHESYKPEENELAEVVSLGLLAWAFRQFGEVLEPEEMYSRELHPWCVEAFNIFRQKHQKCSYTFPDGTQCVQREVSHNTGQHFDRKGNREPGAFEPSGHDEKSVIERIHQLFVNRYEEFCLSENSTRRLPSHEHRRQIRENQLREFYLMWRSIRSNKTCFSCLQAVPDHVMPCGHAYCVRCVREFGIPSSVYEEGFFMDHCVLCHIQWPGQGQLVLLKPRCAGVRVLSLDGGGVRGVVSLALLEALETRIGLDVQFRDFFDLIMGTSTGGIIALGIALSPLKARGGETKIGDMKREFMRLAERTFKRPREGVIWRKVDYFRLTSGFCMLFRIWNSIYPTRPLRDCLQGLLHPNVKLFAAAPNTQEQRHTRVAVTAAKNRGGDRCLISNYNRPDWGAGDDFEREDEDDKEMTAWEAGLATAAAPFYFKPYVKAETGKDYVDGALKVNCPASYALDEAGRIWPQGSEQTAPLDYLVTVGTGIQRDEVHIPTPLKIGGFEQICTSFLNNMNSEKIWQEFESKTATAARFRHKIYRLNARLHGHYIPIDDHRTMRDLDAMVQRDASAPASILDAQIAALADRLVANLFFFEPDGADDRGGLGGGGGGGGGGREAVSSPNRSRMTGTIRCRLAKNTLPLRYLADRGRIEGFFRTEYRASHRPLPDEPPPRWQEIPFSDEQRTDVRRMGGHFRVPCALETMEPSELHQVVVVVFQGGGRDIRNAISGFPVTFRELQRRASAG